MKKSMEKSMETENAANAAKAPPARCGGLGLRPLALETRESEATLTEGMLATNPADPEVHGTYVAAKGREAAKDELDAHARAVAELRDLEKGATVFARDAEGRPAIFNYQVKGALKESAGALKKMPGTECSALKAHKKAVDLGVFVEPRLIALELPEGGAVGRCERPLRAQTMQGERMALASSEEVPAGTRFRFRVSVTQPGLWGAVEECLAYLRWHGLGCWRNSGKGSAEVKRIS